jgi:hypothetical protein
MDDPWWDGALIGAIVGAIIGGTVGAIVQFIRNDAHTPESGQRKFTWVLIAGLIGGLMAPALGDLYRWILYALSHIF